MLNYYLKISVYLLLLTSLSNSCAYANFSKSPQIIEAFLGTQEDTTEVQVDFREMLRRSYFLSSTGRFDEAFRHNIKTIELAKEAEDDLTLHYSYNYLGYDYLVLEDTIKARESLLESYDYAQKTNDPAALANSYTSLANLFTLSDSTYDKGIFYYKRAVKLNKNIQDTLGLENVYYNYYTALSSRPTPENVAISDELMDSMRQLLTSPNVSNDFRASINLILAQRNLDNYNVAKRYFENAIAIASKNNYNETLAAAYKEYSQALESKNQYKEAYQYLAKHDSIEQLNQLFKNDEVSKRLAAKYNNKKMEEDIARENLVVDLQKKQIDNKTTLNYLFAGIITLALAFLLIAIYLLKRRKQFIKVLKKKNDLFLEARKQAQQLAKVKSDFFSTVSHELRTPLYGVIGLSTILLEKNKNKEIAQDLRSLKFSADYLLALVNDVLHINKIDSKTKIENSDDVFNVIDLVKNIVSTFEYLKNQNGNQISIRYANDIPFLVKGNVTILSQILMNLLGNACKFTEQGKITVTVQRVLGVKDSCLKFSITDTGHGIGQEKIDSIFEEFTQGEQKSYNYQGTGLGLSIVKKLLNAVGSRIHVDSTLGKGSTFWFEYELEEMDNQGFGNTQVQKIYTTELLRGCDILIVEDNKINQMVTKKILEKHDVNCDVAENGQEAVDLTQHKEYDLILMDVNMPIMDGMEAAGIIRQYSDVPILALTAVELDEMRAKIMDSGMDDIIVKPYDLKEFQQTIIRYIQERKEKKRTALTAS